MTFRRRVHQFSETTYIPESGHRSGTHKAQRRAFVSLDFCPSRLRKYLMSTAFFDRYRTTPLRWSVFPKPPAALPIAISGRVPQEGDVITRFTGAWTTLQRTLEAVPISALLCNDDQWGQTICPDIATALSGAWQQAACLASHLEMHGVSLSTLVMFPRTATSVGLLFNLYYTHCEVARALITIDEQLLHPTRVSARSVRAQVEALIQQYSLCTDHLRRLQTVAPCHNNPKCYPWHCDRVW